jgi:hypothetical protein
MITITREQAICMFYHKPYDRNNVAELLKSIKSLNDQDTDCHQYPALLKISKVTICQ